jgi:hypothetical protein
VIYGMMPIAFMYAQRAAFGVVSILLENVFHVAGRWWYGHNVGGTWQVGAVGWLTRSVGVLCIVWLVSWWWHAAGAVYCGRGKGWVRVMTVVLAIGVAVVLYVRFLNYWDQWTYL